MSQGRCRYESGQRGMDDLRYGLCMYESGQLQNLSPHPPGLTPTGRPGSPPSTCCCFLCLTGSGRQPTRWPPVPRPERLTTSTTLREEEGQEQQQRIPCLAGFRSVPGNPDLSQGQRTPPLPPSGLPLSRMRLLFLTAPHLSAGASGLCPQPVLGPCRVPRCPGRNGGLSLTAPRLPVCRCIRTLPITCPGAMPGTAAPWTRWWPPRGTLMDSSSTRRRCRRTSQRGSSR